MTKTFLGQNPKKVGLENEPGAGAGSNGPTLPRKPPYKSQKKKEGIGGGGSGGKIGRWVGVSADKFVRKRNMAVSNKNAKNHEKLERQKVWGDREKKYRQIEVTATLEGKGD